MYNCKETLTGGVLAGLLAATSVTATASAESVAQATSLTAEQAIQIALAEVPGEIRELELEDEAGKRVFEIEIMAAQASETTVKIDAMTGDILKIEVEDDDDYDD